MADIARSGPKVAKAAEPVSAAGAPRAKPRFPIKELKKSESAPATPSQVSEAKSAIAKIGRIDAWIREHLNALAFYPTEKYDLHSEKGRMCVALYILKNLEDIRGAAEQRGDSGSYSLFISAAKAATEVLAPDLFLDNRDQELAHRFGKLQPHFEACSSAFGTPSLSLQEIQDKFGFRLSGLVNERRKAGLQ